RGHLALDLEAVEEDVGLGGRFLVTFERSDRHALTVRFFPGDLVELRPRKADVESPPTGIVSRATATRVQVAFDRAPPAVVRAGRLRMDRIPNDVTFDRARAGLRRIAALEKGRDRHKREVLLGREAPVFTTPEKGEPTRRLNSEQESAVELALSAGDLFL